MACNCQGATVNSCGSCSFDCVNSGDTCGPMGCGTCSEGGGGSSLCFVAGTKVAMADGTEKNIEEIEIGDEVKSWNAVTNEFESNKVTKLISPVHDDMVVLKWEHTSVKSTFDHPFWSVVDNDWASYKPELTKERYEFCNVEQLVVGNKGLFLTDDGVIESELISIEEDMGEVQTYIFELDNNNTFFANGIATHNKGPGPGGGPPAVQPVPVTPPKPFSIRPGGKPPVVYSRTRGRNTACPKGYRMQRGVCKEVNRTNTGPVGAHGYGSSGQCEQMRQECSASNGYVSSYTTPPFCSCNTVNAFVWDVQGVNFNYGDCDYYADWDGFSECVMETHSNNLALGQYQLEQMSTTDMHQNCNFDMSSCLLSAYGGGGFGGGNIGFKEQTGTSPGKSGFGMRRGGRIRRRRR